MPCDYKNYPLDWHTRIRPAILARAGNRCECCGVSNYSVLRAWDHALMEPCSSYREANFRKLVAQDAYLKRMIVVVLTVAHLDHELLHNDPSNLQAMCQRCHNRHDAAHRAAKRRATLAAKADHIAPRMPLFPLKRADVMPSMRAHHAIAPLIDPAS